MSRVPVVEENREAAGTLADLARVREQIIELLAWLDRPPRSLRVEAGAVAVDIAWDDAAALAAARPAGANAAFVVASADTTEDTATVYLRSPAVGVFYHAREPGAEPFVSVGSMVWPKQQIGIIEAMKLMIPVEADRAGTITAVVKGNGEPVEFDEPLFALEAEEV